jgi:hypothetical protein
LEHDSSQYAPRVHFACSLEWPDVPERSTEGRPPNM